jgi:ketosteroid isomerase-like protein
MFERYTENSRRVIFFARFEASQYGSRQIETEHLLLGLLREGHTLMRNLLGSDLDLKQIRTEIEKKIVKRERFATSVEVPLSEESRKILRFAAEEATELGTRYVGMEHLLLALLRVDGSVAARILTQQGCRQTKLREQVAKLSASVTLEGKSQPKADPVTAINAFLARLISNNPGEIALLFAKNAQVVDYKGARCRGRDEIEKESQRLFAAYAMKDFTFQLESVHDCPGDTLIASVLWKNVAYGLEPTSSNHRMTVLLAQEGGNWTVFFLQVTPVTVP